MQKIINIKQTNYIQLLPIMKTQTQQTKPGNAEAESHKLQGNQAFKSKNYKQAIQSYTQAIKLNSTEPSYYSNRAICYFNLDKFEQCLSDCAECLKLDPTFGKAIKRKAMALQQILKFEQAVTAFRQAYAIDKDVSTNNMLETAQSFKSNYDRYFTHMNNGEYEDALKCINYLCNKITNNEQLKMYRVQALAKTGQTADALTLIKTISMATTTNPDTWYLKGIIQLYGGDSARAKKYFMQGMRLDPDHNKCRLALNTAKKCEQLKEEGNEFIKLQKYEQAGQKYTEAIELDPANRKMNSVIYSNRAQTYIKRKQNLKAIDDLNKSLELDPNYTKSLMRRAQVNMERGEYSAAIMDYSKIESLDSSANLKQKIKIAQKKEKEAKKKDYYKILQIQRNASDAQIKKAYKKLAMKYHPDRNSSKSQAEQDEASRKFKQIAEAHGVLTDSKKKQLYDSGQMQYDGDERMGGMGGTGGIDPNDIFRMFFGGGGGMGGMGGFSGMSGFSGMGGGKRGQNFSYKFG